jgi:hypothetical protein
LSAAETDAIKVDSLHFQRALFLDECIDAGLLRSLVVFLRKTRRENADDDPGSASLYRACAP